MIQGKFVGLRAIELADLDTLLSWRNKPAFRRYFREYRELSGEHQRIWFREKVMNDASTRMFAIQSLESSALIGACGLCYIDWINRSADFSIYIGRDDVYIDGVYAIDASRLLIGYGFNELNLHRLWSEIYDFDDAKVRMFGALGFQRDGRHRQTHWTEGAWCDSLFFSLLRTDPLVC